MNFDLKMGVKMNSRIIMKNHAADPAMGLLTKSISKLFGRATAMPPAWKLTQLLKFVKKKYFLIDSSFFLYYLNVVYRMVTFSI